MMRPTASADLPPVWRALADPTRRRVLDLLRTRPMTTGQLVQQFEITRFGVMKHLQILVDAGLVLVRRRGRQRWNHLNPVPIQQIYRRWIRPFEAVGGDALLRVTHVAEREIETGDHQSVEEKMSSTASGTPEPMTDRFRTIDVHLEVHIRASRQQVWRALTADIGAWWPKAFYVGSSPRAFVLESRVGGRVYEDWGDGQGMLFALVNAVREGELLQWVGDMGPDYGGPARTMATFTLQSVDDGTVLQFRDTPYGLLAEESIDGTTDGWTFLLSDCLKPYVETGKQPERPETVRSKNAGPR